MKKRSRHEYKAQRCVSETEFDFKTRASQLNSLEQIFGNAKAIARRMASKIQINNETGCWTWIGATDGHGYGQVTVAGKKIKAHRMAWMLHNLEPITKADHICHSCDNPSCVNPAHLFKANNAVNKQDAAAKFKILGGLGRLSDWSKLKKEQILDIRARVNRREDLTSIANSYLITPSDVHGIATKEDWPWLI